MNLGNAQNAAKSVTSLVNAQRTAETLARNLDEVYQAISTNELRDSLRPDPNPARLTPYYEAAAALRQHHDDSISQLSTLTADLGLLQVDLSRGPLSDNEQEYLRLVTTARGVKTALWQKISRYQDEINPLRESRRQGGGALIGSSHTLPAN